MDMKGKKALITCSYVLCRLLSNIKDCGTMSSDSDSDSEVGEIMEKCVRIPRTSIVNYFEEVVQSYSRTKFIRHFHITPEFFTCLSHDYGRTDEYQKMVKYNPNRVLKPEKMFAIYLWFAAHAHVHFEILVTVSVHH